MAKDSHFVIKTLLRIRTVIGLDHPSIEREMHRGAQRVFDLQHDLVAYEFEWPFCLLAEHSFDDHLVEEKPDLAEPYSRNDERPLPQMRCLYRFDQEIRKCMISFIKVRNKQHHSLFGLRYRFN